MTAREIIDRFGGQSALARLIGKGQSTVAYWAKSGVIPAKWQSQLLEIAKTNFVSLTPSDFVSGQESSPPSPTPKIVSAAGSSKGHSLAAATGIYTLTMGSPATPVPVPQSDFLFYSSDDGLVKVQVMLSDETVWASQKGIAEIFGTSRENISMHLSNIFAEKELESNSVSKIFL